MKQQSSPIITLALLLVAGGTTLGASAQTAADTFPLPTSVTAGTKVQIDGSSSLQAVNQGLKDRFTKQFPGTDVTVPTQYQGSDSGVKAVADDKADLAGIGRVLTPAEKAQGLGSKTIGRSKIAIIVKTNNPYTGNLTLSDFAKIYRGEVTDWSQLPSAKGATGKIKVIDRPDTSDTRRAFANYPVFQNGKLKTGSNAQKLTEDSTQSVVDKLGDDGIGYAPADQIKNIPGIRAVTLHSTQPDNPKYPFSQPLIYAYKNKGGKVSEGAKAFLGYASDPAVQTALLTGAAAVAVATPTPSPAATTAPDATPEAVTPAPTGAAPVTTDANQGGFPWWILPLVAIGGGLLWMFGRKKPTENIPVAPIPDAAGIKPLYPPQPTTPRTPTAGLSGDLSGDLSSARGGYRPSGDLRSGDLRSGDLSATLPSPPTASTPNINFNGVVDTVKGKADGIGLAGGAAIAGGAAAAAAMGKGVYDSVADRAEEIKLPEIKAPEIKLPEIKLPEIKAPEIKVPEINLSNPLEGLKDKSSNLIPNLELGNPLEGLKDKFGDTIQGGGTAAIALGGAALAGGAALVGGAGKLFEPQSSDLSLETPDFELTNPLDDVQDKVGEIIPDFELNNPLDGVQDKVGDIIPDFELNNPLDDVQDKVGDIIPDFELHNPLDDVQDKVGDIIPDVDRQNDGIFDKVGDFFKDGGGTVVAGGAAVVAGGAALASGAGNSVADLFGASKEEAPEELWLDEPAQEINDPFDFGNPLDAVADKAADLKDQAADLVPDFNDDPFDFGNPLDAVADKAADLKDQAADLVPDFNDDPFDFSNPLDAVADKAGDLKDQAADLVPDFNDDPFDFSNPLDAVADKAGDLKDQAADLVPDFNDDPFDFSNPLDAVADKAADLKDQAADLVPDFNDDPFDFSNPLDAVADKAGDLKDQAADLVPDLSEDPFDFTDLTDQGGDFLKGSGAAAVAAGAATVAGGAALFGGEQKPEIADFALPNPEMDTFDRDLEEISLDGFDEDPFSGLSDLLGEETGDISNEIPKPETSDVLSSLKDKASDLLADGKGLGAAALAGGAAATVGAAQAVQSFFQKDAPTIDRDDVAGTLYTEGQITLVAPSETQAYAHWEIPVRLKKQLREQGGQKLVVRLYDVTNVDTNVELPATFQEFECSDSDWDLELPIKQSEHRYLTEIGYVTEDGRWLMLARSAPLWVRAN